MEEVPSADLVITSYALMRRDIEKHVSTPIPWHTNEAQQIKNRATQNALRPSNYKQTTGWS